jgi:tetratricopeptide (TPR) repeat protein
MLGLILMEAEEYNEAEEYLQEAVKAFADNLEYTRALIKCYKKLQKYDLALKSCIALLEDQKELSSEWWDSKIEQLSLYFELKEYNKITEETARLITHNDLPPGIKEKLEKAKENTLKFQPQSAPANNKSPAPK